MPRPMRLEFSLRQMAFSKSTIESFQNDFENTFENVSFARSIAAQNTVILITHIANERERTIVQGCLARNPEIGERARNFPINKHATCTAYTRYNAFEYISRILIS